MFGEMVENLMKCIGKRVLSLRINKKMFVKYYSRVTLWIRYSKDEKK